MSLFAKGVGVFPGIKRPRIVWVGLSGQLESLVDLQRQLEERLEGLGFEKDKRPFKGHLTLGRVKGRLDPKQLGGALKRYGGFTSETFYAENVVLYKSELKPTGAVYTEIVNVPIK
jgi:2'-5' RNA ligase